MAASTSHTEAVIIPPAMAGRMLVAQDHPTGVGSIETSTREIGTGHISKNRSKTARSYVRAVLAILLNGNSVEALSRQELMKPFPVLLRASPRRWRPPNCKWAFGRVFRTRAAMLSCSVEGGFFGDVLDLGLA